MLGWTRWICVGLALAASTEVGAVGHPEFEARLAEINAELVERPDDASLYLRRGRLYHDHGDWDRALADYERAAAQQAGLAQLPCLRAATLLDAGFPRTALVIVETVLMRDAGQTTALCLRARAMTALGRVDEAATALGVAIEGMDSPALDLRVELARTLAKGGGGLDAALASLDRAMARLGPLVSLRLEAVSLARQTGRVDLAIARLDRLIEDTPNPARHLWLRALLLVESGQTAEAVDQLHAVCDEIDAMPQGLRARPGFVALREAARAAATRLAAGDPVSVDALERLVAQHDQHPPDANGAHP